MEPDPHNAPPPAAPAHRLIRISEIIVLVLLWNSAYKGVGVLNTLYALELGAGPFDIGILLATYAVFPLVLAVYAGKLSDRYGPRLPILIGMIACAVGILLPFLVPTLPMLFVAAAVAGAGFTSVQVSMQSLTGSLGGGAVRTHNFNLYALGVSTAGFLGPVVAGFSIDHFGHVRTYLHLSVLSAAAVIALLCFMPRLPRVVRSSGSSGRRSMADLLRDRTLLRVFLASSVVITGVDLFQLYLPLHGHAASLSAGAIGMVLGAFAAATFVSRALISVLVHRFGGEQTLLYSLLLAAATFFLIPFFTHVLVLGLICFVLGLGLGLGQPLSVMLAYDYSPVGRGGEVLGLRIAINNSVHVVVPVVFGAVGSLFGLAPVFWLSSAFLAAGGYWSCRKRA